MAAAENLAADCSKIYRGKRARSSNWVSLKWKRQAEGRGSGGGVEIYAQRHTSAEKHTNAVEVTKTTVALPPYFRLPSYLLLLPRLRKANRFSAPLGEQSSTKVLGHDSASAALFQQIIALGRIKRHIWLHPSGSRELQFAACRDVADAWFFSGMIQHLGRIRLFGGKKGKHACYWMSCVCWLFFKGKEPGLAGGFCRKNTRKFLSCAGYIFGCNLCGSLLMNNSKYQSCVPSLHQESW